jgi:hypothetical protein
MNILLSESTNNDLLKIVLALAGFSITLASVLAGIMYNYASGFIEKIKNDNKDPFIGFISIIDLIITQTIFLIVSTLFPIIASLLYSVLEDKNNTFDFSPYLYLLFIGFMIYLKLILFSQKNIEDFEKDPEKNKIFMFWKELNVENGHWKKWDVAIMWWRIVSNIHLFFLGIVGIIGIINPVIKLCVNKIILEIMLIENIFFLLMSSILWIIPIIVFQPMLEVLRSNLEIKNEKEIKNNITNPC